MPTCEHGHLPWRQWVRHMSVEKWLYIEEGTSSVVPLGGMVGGRKERVARPGRSTQSRGSILDTSSTPPLTPVSLTLKA